LDLGPAWNSSLEITDSGDFSNANGTNDELPVRNSSDGHFYEWWIANNQLQGADLGNAHPLRRAARKGPRRAPVPALAIARCQP
jgi:hypothetical protein